MRYTRNGRRKAFACAAAITAVAALSACAQDEPDTGELVEQELVRGSDASSIAAMIPPFAREPTAEDAFPEGYDGGLGEFEEDAIRRSGETDVGTYWVAVGDGPQICLIQLVDEEGETGSSSCGHPGDFYMSGMYLATTYGGDPAAGERFYLLPADIDQSAIRGDAAEPRGEGEANWFALETGDHSLEPVDVEREDGAVFTFQP
ncbi:hypothetical protein FM112_02355 [Gulosibacter sp. 10]|nr:hypothetical protein FM112_02355 [Gulosibacter sp. 10]